MSERRLGYFAIAFAATIPSAAIPLFGTRLSLFPIVALVITFPRILDTPVSSLGALVFCGVGLVAATAWVGALTNDPKVSLLLVSLCGAAVLIAPLWSQPNARDQLLTATVISITVWSFIGLMQVTGVVHAHLQTQDITALRRPQGWYPEPDYLGLFAAIGLYLCVWESGSLKMKRYVVRIAAVICGLALLLSFARAAWLAFIAALAYRTVLAITTNRRETTRRSVRRVAGTFASIVFAVTLALSFSPMLRSDIGRRIETFTTRNAESDVSGEARRRQTTELLALGRAAPWYCWGFTSSGRVDSFGGVITDGRSPNNVGSNLFLSLWLEAKLLALPLLLTLVVLCVSRGSFPSSRPLMVLILINSIFSNVFMFSMCWFVISACLLKSPEVTRDRARVAPH